MNRYQAIQSFFSGFGIPAYAESAVPAQADYPYLTYRMVDGDFLSGVVPMEVDLWYYTDSESKPNSKVSEIAQAIGFGGKMLIFDDGAICLRKGSPWAQSVPDDAGDEKVKHRYLNVDVEYISM